MKKILTSLTIITLLLTLVGCKFADEKKHNEVPERVAFLNLDVLDILNDVGFEKTGIKEMGMLFKGNVDYLDKFNNDKNVIDLGSHREISYDKLTMLDPELIILGNRTTSEKEDLSKRYPKAKIYDATHKISEGNLLETMKKNIDFLGETFPDIKEELNNKYNEIEKEINEIKKEVINKRALMLVLSGSEKRSYGTDSRFGMIYKEFGFKLADSTITSQDAHGEVLSDERIKSINPEVIFVLDRSKTVGQETSVSFDDLFSNTLIKETIAGKNKDLYLLDGNAWYMTSGGFVSARNMIKDMKAFINK